jgi:hypothetical protein
MASIVFDSMFDKWARGAIDFDTDTFNWMLTTESYVEDRAAHVFRSSVTNEVVGVGYVAGGKAAAVTVNLDTVNHRLDIVIGEVTWPASSISASKAVAYKARGGAAAADELIMVNDFGAPVSTTSGNLTVSASTVRVQN